MFVGSPAEDDCYIASFNTILEALKSKTVQYLFYKAKLTPRSLTSIYFFPELSTVTHHLHLQEGFTQLSWGLKR